MQGQALSREVEQWKELPESLSLSNIHAIYIHTHAITQVLVQTSCSAILLCAHLR